MGTWVGSKKLILTHLRGSRTYFTYSIEQTKKETIKQNTSTCRLFFESLDIFSIILSTRSDTIIKKLLARRLQLVITKIRECRWDRSKVKTLLLQICPLCKFHMIEGQKMRIRLREMEGLTVCNQIAMYPFHLFWWQSNWVHTCRARAIATWR